MLPSTMRLTPFLLLCLLPLLTACRGEPPPLESRGYVGTYWGDVIVFDTRTLREWHRVGGMGGIVDALERDPAGNVWVGAQRRSSTDFAPRHVHVLSPEAEVLHKLEVCYEPYQGIYFAQGRAFIVCDPSLSPYDVVVVDLASYEVVQRIELPLNTEGSYFRTQASGATEDTVLVAGYSITSPDKTSLLFFLVDARTLAIQGPFPLEVTAASVVTYAGHFYLLNSDRGPRGTAGDLTKVTLGSPPALTQLRAEPAPFRGALHGSLLYSVHGDNLGSSKISRYNLETGELRTWPLPEEWVIEDVDMIGEALYLLRSGFGVDGLYQVDLEAGTQKRVFEVWLPFEVLGPARAP